MSTTQILETTSQTAAIDFIKLLFEPGDLLCLAFQDAETAKWVQVFRRYEDAIKPETMAQIQQANELGNNIYVTMNVYRTTSRKEADIAAIRTVWAELDENGRENLDKIFASKVVPEPTIVNESSPGKFHAIWKVKDFTVGEAKVLLKSICAEFNGDKNAIDAARVLRLPGFKNCKYPERPEIEVVHLSDNASAHEASEFALVPKKAAPTTAEPSAPAAASTRSEEETAKRIAAIFEKGQKVAHGGRNSGLTSVAGSFHNLGLSLQELEDQLVLYNDRFMEPPLDISEVRTIAGSINKKPVVDPDAVTVIIDGRPAGENPVPASVPAQAPAPWPKAQPLDDKLPPVAAFKPEFLPESVRAWVLDVSERMSVPLDFAGICAINTIAGVVGRRAFVYPKANDKDWKESLALSGFIVAESGKTKTPTWKMFTNVVSEKAKDWEDIFKEAKSKYEADLLLWKKAEQANKAAEKKGEFSFSVPPPPDEPKPARRLILNDATPEIAHEVMKTNSAGLFYFRDELSGWIAELDKEGRETQLAMFLSAMNGDDTHTVDRIGREGGTAKMCLAVFGGIQPDKFREFLSSTENIDNGMVPRFSLGVWPDDADLPTVDRGPNNDAKLLYRNIIRNAAEMLEEQVSLHFDSEAQIVFNSWQEELRQKIKREDNSGKKSHLSKYKGVLPRVAAIFQLVDLISKCGSAMGNNRIDMNHLNQAIGLLTYLETHMHRIYDSAQNLIQRAETQIAQRIKDRSLKSGFTVRVIQRKCWYALTKVEYIDLALENLEEKGWLRRMTLKPGPEGGRPTAYWDINPSLL